MSKRTLFVNWVGINGAARHKRKLILRPSDTNIYICPVKNCLHVGFKSSRGLRKHIDKKHGWYYYFDEAPDVKREEVVAYQPTKKKICTANKPAFSVNEGIGKDFLEWLCTPCGGGKSEKEAKQCAQRCMKFLMASIDDVESESVLTEEFVDCCLGTPSIIMDFLKMLEEDWKITSSASLNYLKSISDILDFRKAHGVSDSTLRCFAVTEVYIRRGKENLGKKKRLEYSRNLDLETLIARNSWATMEEMENVIPYHICRFRDVLQECKDAQRSPSVSQLAFATRFVATYLFVRVKCSRPMTYQYLTIEMIEKAKTNGGFVDQKEFKTADRYLFDTVILDSETLEILDFYIDLVRPKLNPSCDYLLVTNKGKQYTAFSTAMSILVHEAIGKYINPTRYRQIVETESAERLTPSEREVVSRDQKHSSHVAKVSYQKNLSRDVASRSRQCMEKLVGNKRKEVSADMMDVLRTINDTARTFDQRVLNQAETILSQQPCTSSSSQVIVDGNDNDDDITITDTIPSTAGKDVTKNLQQRNQSLVSLISSDVQLKREVVNEQTKQTRVKFTKEEDLYLCRGISKYGKGCWSRILKDSEYSFHPCRNKDSLRVRSESLAFKRNTSPSGN